MRAALAIAAVVLLLVAAIAPHAHEGPLGTHACFACAAVGAEQASRQTPEVAPRPLQPVALAQVPPAAPVAGVPLGAIPGQSPPGA